MCGGFCNLKWLCKNNETCFFFSLLWNRIISTLLNKPYYFPMYFHYCIWSYDSYIMVIHSLALRSQGLFLECYLKLVWLINDFEAQWFRWFCIYLLEFNVFIYDLFWHFAVDFPGSRWLLGVNHDILESLNSWIIGPKMKCALLLSWEISLHLTSVMQHLGSRSYLRHAPCHLRGLGQWFGMWLNSSLAVGTSDGTKTVCHIISRREKALWSYLRCECE